MAAFHIRSISLPSRSHPLTSSIEEQIYKLKTPQSSSIGHKLAGLKELFCCVDDFLQLPLTQQTLSHERHNRSIEAALNGSLALLDMCGTTRDFLSQMRECVQVLESSIRRKRGGESVLNEIDGYMVSKKKLNKVICKYLRNLKRNETNCRTKIMDDSSDLLNIISMLKGAEDISLSLLKSIISFISFSNTKSKLSSWSIVSKLLQSKHVLCEEEVEAHEVEKIDAQLLVLKSSKDNNQMQNILKGLETLDSSLQELEEDLGVVYRQLVKTRVSLLNTLNH